MITATRVIKALLYIQLTAVAFFQISWVLNWMLARPVVHRIFFVSGLIFNYGVRDFQVAYLFLNKFHRW